MPFWKKETPEELERKALAALQEAEQLESLVQLREGGIPVPATRRLQKQASLDGKFFSCNFSPAEYLLARQAGYQPLSQVVGSVFTRMEMGDDDYGVHSSYSGPLSSFTIYKSHAQALAVERLRQEAKILGAHGVIGVTVRTSRYSWSDRFAQFSLTGTAVRLPDSAALRQAPNLPFTSTLSGQEFWQLYESGYWPCSLVIGNGVYLACNPWSNPKTMALNDGPGMIYTKNVELHTYSEGVKSTKEMAMTNLMREVHEGGADGAVDMHIDCKMTKVPSMDNVIIDFTAVGTGVLYCTGSQQKAAGNRLLIMDLARKTNETIKVPTADE